MRRVPRAWSFLRGVLFEIGRIFGVYLYVCDGRELMYVLE